MLCSAMTVQCSAVQCSLLVLYTAMAHSAVQLYYVAKCNDIVYISSIMLCSAMT